METVKTQLTDFLKKCEEVKNCKFIMATTKIKDVLKSIVNSEELYELFNTVAANFDYVAAKQKCFIESDGVYGNSRIALPETVGDRLAFIFCLLVEFDRNDINFNAFLQKYYPKDGSYYSSYHLFCDEIIGSLEMIICDIFARELAAPEAPVSPEGQIAAAARASLPQRATPSPDAARGAELASSINAVNMFISSEREAVVSSSLEAEDKEAACAILDSLSRAVADSDAAYIKSLTCGYNYLVLHTRFVSEVTEALFMSLGGHLSKI